jgi:2-oxoisovalerate dehydrogenase E1 component beta subunit
MAAKGLREVGRRRAAEVGRRWLSGGSAGPPAPAAKRKEGGKAVNLFTAVNQALHIALDTDPR